MKKIITNPIVFILLGIILGIASKYGDIAYSNSFFSYFGLFSSGLLMWLILCTAILYLSETKKQSIMSVLYLMLPMLLSYYVCSYFFADYLSLRVVLFWGAILVAVLILTHCIWGMRYKKSFRILFLAAAVLTISYDAVFVNGVSFEIMIPEIILAVIAFLCVNKTIKKTQDR